MTAFFNELLSMAFEASVLIVVILAIRLIFRKMPKQFKKTLWGLVGIKLLIPFSFKSPLSLMPKTPDLTADGVTAAPAPKEETPPTLSPESRAFLESLHTQIHIPDEHYTQPNIQQFPERDNDNSHMDIPGYVEEINLFPGNPTPDPYASSPSPYYN